MSLTIRFKFHGRCRKHPRFNPAKGGLGGIVGGCIECSQLYRVWAKVEQAKSAARFFDGERISETEARRDDEPTVQSST